MKEVRALNFLLLTAAGMINAVGIILFFAAGGAV